MMVMMMSLVLNVISLEQPDPGMIYLQGEDSVTECVADGTSVTVYVSHNSGQTNERLSPVSGKNVYY